MTESASGIATLGPETAAGPDMHRFAGASLKRRTPASGGLPGDLGDAAIDWLATMQRVNDDFAGPALRTALLETGAIDRIPGDARGYLDLLYEENARCNRHIRKQCDEIGAALAEAGVDAVLLKGATWLFEDGPAQDDRMMRDIDLLVGAASIDTARTAIRGIGYRRSPLMHMEAGHIHDAPLIHRDGLVSVELHAEVTTRTYLLTGAEVVAASRPIAPGLRVPSPAHRIVHNVIHAQIFNGDYIGGVIGLRDSLDIARIASAHLDEIDWNAMAGEARGRGYFRQLSGATHKAALFAGGPLPQPFADDTGGLRHAQRCARQQQSPLLDAVMRRYGILCRALAWERDSYALKLGDDRSLSAHLKVNLRRARRIGSALAEAMRRG